MMRLMDFINPRSEAHIERRAEKRRAFLEQRARQVVTLGYSDEE